MFLPPRVRSTRQKSRHAQRSVTFNALPLRKLESDAALVAATTTAGGPFFSAAKKIRIRRGDSLQKAAHPQQIPQHAF